MKIKNFNFWLIKIDRISAWVLFFSMILFFLSGYGLTKKIINAEIALKLHQDILPFISLTAFCLHTFLAIRLFFIRLRILNKFTLAALTLFYLLFFTSFVYFDLFYQPSKKFQEEKISQEKEKIFTLEELKKYNGRNGQPAYVAVDGIVYDLTEVFKNGTHYRHLAGEELGKEFFSIHRQSQIDKYPVVGKLKK